MSELRLSRCRSRLRGYMAVEVLEAFLFVPSFPLCLAHPFTKSSCSALARRS